MKSSVDEAAEELDVAEVVQFPDEAVGDSGNKVSLEHGVSRSPDSNRAFQDQLPVAVRLEKSSHLDFS